MITAADVQGHWVRQWIKAPGFEDHATRVHWMQAGRLYADVRIPLDRPDVGASTCLADLPAASLSKLAQAEGFAGHATLQGNRCTWHRDINWHGAPDALDIGEIRFDQQGRMIETGVLAEYSELWVQAAETETSAIRFSNDGYSGVLVVAGDVAVLGIGQTSKPSTKPLVRTLENGRIPKNIDTLFDGLHALCRLEHRRVIATLATDPLAEGQLVVSLSGDVVIWHKAHFDGTRSEIEMQTETVSA